MRVALLLPAMLLAGCATLPPPARPQVDAGVAEAAQRERVQALGLAAGDCAAPAWTLEGRVALEEVLKRFPSWEVDMANARRSRTSTVRGWDSMPTVVGA